jgi:hypothetical protein
VLVVTAEDVWASEDAVPRSRREHTTSESCFELGEIGNGKPMLSKRMHDSGLRGWHCHLASLGSVGLCVGLWIRAKTVDQDERGNAERRALFVGLWPPMLWLIGDSLERHETRRLRLPWSD